MIRYLSCAETAQLARAALKQQFPAVKFSVKSKTYSGGASIYVSWTDGPATKAVEAIVNAFAGSGFDGMIDLKYQHDHWLMPDGTIQYGGTSGTISSMGVVPPSKIPAPLGGQRVSPGADYVLCHRRYSEQLLRRAVQIVKERYGVEAQLITYPSGEVTIDRCGPRVGNDTAGDLVYRTIQELAA